MLKNDGGTYLKFRNIMKQKHGNKKVSVQTEFARWCATPEPLRDPQTQGEFARLHNVNEATLSRWRREPEFWDEVKKGIKVWNKERLPNVLAALYKNILKNGHGVDVKMWLQWVDDWKEKSDVDNPTMTGEVDKLRGVLKDMIEAIRKAK
jgi:hypothetical protein